MLLSRLQEAREVCWDPLVSSPSSGVSISDLPLQSFLTESTCLILNHQPLLLLCVFLSRNNHLSVSFPLSLDQARVDSCAEADWSRAEDGVLIAGAGIAGLATAAALHRVRFERLYAV